MDDLKKAHYQFDEVIDEGQFLNNLYQQHHLNEKRKKQFLYAGPIEMICLFYLGFNSSLFSSSESIYFSDSLNYLDSFDSIELLAENNL
jgi:hypothetical protein